MNIKWLQLDVNILDNDKIKLIRKFPDGDKLFVLWIGLLSMAMKSDILGSLYIAKGIPYDDQDLSVILDIEVKTINMGLKLFEKYGMISICEGGIIEIVNFEKHQSIDKIEHFREQSRLSSKRYREKAKQLQIESDNVTVTSRDHIEKNRLDKITLDKNKEEDNKSNSKKSKQFKIPTILKVKEYCQERKNQVNAEKFHDYYTSKGWLVGKSKMKDWKASVRTWEKNTFDSYEKQNNKGGKIWPKGEMNFTI